MTAFTDAVRAVLSEADIDGLPDPVNIRPGDNTVDVDVQVPSSAFAAWSGLVGSFAATESLTFVTEGSVQMTSHKLYGTVAGHRVLLSAVRAEEIVPDQHIADAKVAAGIALATTDSEYDR